jgi:putative peptidoglycan lipid II flippase
VAPEQDKKPGPHIAKSAGIASAAIFLSRISGVLRESVMGSLFGASAQMDAFILGFRIPNLTRDLFAEGALSSAFVPIFTKYLTTKGKGEARELYNLVATALILIVGVICLLGMIFTPQLVELFASPFHQIPGKFELAVKLTRIMFPFLLLVALAAQAMGVLNACNLFGIPALSSVCFNLGSVAFGLLFGYALGISPILGMAWGVVVGGALQLFSQVPSLIRAGFVFSPAINFNHPGLRHVLRLMGPAILGNASVQINVLVNSNFATGITDAAGHVMSGPVSWLNYAFRFMQLPLGLFGVAIASATLPAISRSAAKNDMGEFRTTMKHSLSLVMLLTLPSAAGLAVVGDSMIALVYQRGRFHAADTHQTAIALSCYAIGLMGYSAVKILAPAFYALNDARTPMVVSLISILINYATAFSMIHFFGLGHAGLALSTSAVALFNFSVLLFLLRGRIEGIEGRALFMNFVKIAMASGLLGGVCWTLGYWLHGVLGYSIKAHLAVLIAAVPAGAGVFYAACRFMGVPELDDAQKQIAGPLLRRLGLGRLATRQKRP